MAKATDWVRDSSARAFRWFMRHGFMLLGYLLLGTAGLSTFGTPSPALSRQAGPVLVLIWAGLCILGSLSGAIGVLLHEDIPDVIGAGLCATACLIWGASVVLQAISADTTGSLTAACVAFTVMSLFLKRFVDVMQPTE